MARIYEIASRLDSWEPQKVIFEAVDVAKELLDIEDVAIYMAGKNTAVETSWPVPRPFPER